MPAGGGDGDAAALLWALRGTGFGGWGNARWPLRLVAPVLLPALFDLPWWVGGRTDGRATQALLAFASFQVSRVCA